MGVPEAIETLAEKASFLREAQQKSQTITLSIVSTLGFFDHRLSTLEEAMRPIQEFSATIRKANGNIDKTLNAADVILGQIDLMQKADAKLLKEPSEDLESYLEAIDQLRSIIGFFSSNKSFENRIEALNSNEVLNSVNSLLAKAVRQLEKDFESHLSSNSKPVEPDNLPKHQTKSLEASVYTPPTLISPEILPLLHNLAQQLVHFGHHQQCLNIYREARASVLEESLREIGVESLSNEDVQKMQWEALEAKIVNWLHFMRIAVKLLFAGERKVCDHIFEGIGTLRDRCFAEATASSVAMLLSLGEAIAKSKRSPEKLFVLLDMYEVMCDLQSEIETVFEGKACSEMRASALSLTKRLAQTAHETFHVFEEAVEKDESKISALDGRTHNLTRYVVKYVKFLFDYRSTLKQIFQEFETGGEENSRLETATLRIMQALQSNLDGKSKQYRDPSLTYIFLMNNNHHIVNSLCRSEAKDLLGDDWIQRQRRIVQKNANQYRRAALSKIVQCLSSQGLSTSGGNVMEGGVKVGEVSLATVKVRLKSFNMEFEDLHLRQSKWSVSDAELRQSLRLSIAEILLPAYRTFICRYGNLVEKGKASKYIRYTPEQIDSKLGEFFQPCPAQTL